MVGSDKGLVTMSGSVWKFSLEINPSDWKSLIHYRSNQAAA
jgi:hypothetical protein